MRHLLRPVLLALATLTASPALAEPAAHAGAIPRYDHIFLVIEENHGFGQIIGNPAAPVLNQLAATYGLATNFFSVADPSAPNYVAMLGGNFFGIADDNPYYTHTVDAPSLMSQLDAAGRSWKGYFQGMPYAGYRGYCYPGRCLGVPDFDPYYSAKHNGIIYFKSVQTQPADRNRMVPIEQLADDLAAEPPAFSYIVPDQCHDMHGSPPWCGDSGNPFDANDNQLVARGDAFIGALVGAITAAPFWSHGTNAIVIAFDQGTTTQGCCDANPGTGRIDVTVITNSGPRGLQDPTSYNHYSLLQTFQKAFGLGCLQFTCDTEHVTPLAPLFANHR
jgi:hypothetical protein